MKGLGEPIEVFRVEAASGARHRLEAASQQRLAPVRRTRECGRGAREIVARRARQSRDTPCCCWASPVSASRGCCRYSANRSAPTIARSSSATARRTTAARRSIRWSRRCARGTASPTTTRRTRGSRACASGLEEHGCEIETALPLRRAAVRHSAGGGLPAARTASADAEAEDRRPRCVSLLTARAGRTPTLLVVEDLHWIDPTTLELLGARARAAADEPAAAAPDVAARLRAAVARQRAASPCCTSISCRRPTPRR